MTLEELKAVLLWSLAIHYGILITWFAVFVFAHDWLYGIHAKWFKLSRETFDALNYAGVAIYKIGVALFVLIPLVAICIAR